MINLHSCSVTCSLSPQSTPPRFSCHPPAQGVIYYGQLTYRLTRIWDVGGNRRNWRTHQLLQTAAVRLNLRQSYEATALTAVLMPSDYFGLMGVPSGKHSMLLTGTLVAAEEISSKCIKCSMQQKKSHKGCKRQIE